MPILRGSFTPCCQNMKILKINFMTSSLRHSIVGWRCYSSIVFELCFGMFDSLARGRSTCWLHACSQKSLLFSPFGRRAKRCPAVHAIQHLLGHLTTLFQHETNINQAIAGSMLSLCWIVWPGTKNSARLKFYQGLELLCIPAIMALLDLSLDNQYNIYYFWSSLLCFTTKYGIDRELNTFVSHSYQATRLTI